MAIRAQGTVIRLTTGALNVTIGQVTGFSGLGGGSTTEIDTSHFASAAKEFLAGLRDNGTITLNVNTELSDLGQRHIWAALNSGAIQDFEIDVPGTGTPLTLSGAVLTFEIGASVDDAYRSTISIRVSGAVGGFPAPA